MTYGNHLQTFREFRLLSSFEQKKKKTGMMPLRHSPRRIAALTEPRSSPSKALPETIPRMYTPMVNKDVGMVMLAPRRETVTESKFCILNSKTTAVTTTISEM